MADTPSLTGAEMNERARQENAGRYLLNTLRNLPHIVNGVDLGRLRDRLSNVPAIVVGAGPSLDQNITALQTFGNRAIVIAADTAWRPLAAAGIDPDIVVALDPTDINGRHLLDVPFQRAPWLFAEGSVDPEALSSLAGRVGVLRVGVHHPWPWLQSIRIERPFVRVWGSVLTAAYELALTFGCNPVVFAGADLAFTNFQPYCRGTSFESDWAVHTARGVSLPKVWKNTLTARTLLREPGVDGERALTSPHLVEFRNWIVSRASEATDRRTVNASRAGILQGPRIEQSSLACEFESRAECGGEIRRFLHEQLAVQQEPSAAPAVLDALFSISREIDPDCEGARPGLIAEWLTFGGSVLTTSQVAAAAAVGRSGLLACATGTVAVPSGSLEPAAAFIVRNRAVVEPDVLTDCGLPRAWVCATADETHAIVTPTHGSTSVCIAADGSFQTASEWGSEISGEVPWGTNGGRLAWNRRTRTVLLSADARQATERPVVQTMPFEPARVAVLPDGSAVWYAFDGGLWLWRPGSDARFLVDTPKCGSLILDGGDLVLAPITRDANGQMVRRRLHYEWRYALASGSLTRVETGPEGQCINVAARGDWTARAFQYSDLVRLDHRDGRSILLAVSAPFGVAWAGPSLLVTSAAADVLLFRDLASGLDHWHMHCSLSA